MGACLADSKVAAPAPTPADSKVAATGTPPAGMATPTTIVAVSATAAVAPAMGPRTPPTMLRHGCPCRTHGPARSTCGPVHHGLLDRAFSVQRLLFHPPVPVDFDFLSVATAPPAPTPIARPIAPPAATPHLPLPAPHAATPTQTPAPTAVVPAQTPAPTAASAPAESPVPLSLAHAPQPAAKSAFPTADPVPAAPIPPTAQPITPVVNSHSMTTHGKHGFR
ncbi:lysine-rich arabinogalactan protein 19-like [Phragmites australis]|uniref:lysine-rich arabinogalactan protein 19-like n=1 Tax=Phragmites australis TaxID=29695 RepID=UPI002D772981|nr:lysine-rich arabinogalactan protein 19-like [Phragmites australis]